MLLYQVVDAFETLKLKYAVIGGYALALHGLVRATMDVDFVLSLRLADFERAEAALGSIGLKSRLPIRAQDVIKMREEYIEKRNLLAWSFVDYSNPARQVDILITEDLRELETEVVSTGGRKVTVVSLKELLRMKKAAGRPQDLVDIENIKKKLAEKKNV
jgi:Nucleotidyl transferase AbiEii toxin, Type IV TA system